MKRSDHLPSINPGILSFTALRDGKALPKAKKGQHNRCFWNVSGTGDYAVDCMIGERLALEYLQYEEDDVGGSGCLNLIVNDMPRPLTGVEHGFLTMVALQARAGRGRARQIFAYWEKCLKEIVDA
ncbi:hypothetical protein [Rhizobium sp. NXC24]|uniref:hypothetical protein n=1 Tax=Rhizobium sp. NXC24 TaxID=2048897 RepID=UPI000CDF3A3C|nr:hypothetical protein [Rhizobium sp. NXC24]AVA20652.1 hypothetical protein NXC24_CH00985 [Rhizobium sp. NXC24]